jgi:hypothetical protein
LGEKLISSAPFQLNYFQIAKFQETKWLAILLSSAKVPSVLRKPFIPNRAATSELKS